MEEVSELLSASTMSVELVLDCQRLLLDGAQNLPYTLRCQGNNPHLFRLKQCSRLECYCVDVVSGALFESTKTLRGHRLSCQPIVVTVVLWAASTPDYPGPSRSPSSLGDRQLPVTLGQRLATGVTELFVNTKGFQQVELLPATNKVKVTLKVTSRGHTSPEAVLVPLQKLLDAGVLAGVPLRVSKCSITRSDLGPSSALLSKNKSSSWKTLPTLVRLPDHDGVAPALQMKPKCNQCSTLSSTDTQSLISQPGIIAAIVGGGITGFFLLVLLILFCIYRLRKKDEGSYALDEPKKVPVSSAYTRAPTREFYA